jgi:cytoskeletal protein CcmA (bactofilin family)
MTGSRSGILQKEKPVSKTNAEFGRGGELNTMIGKGTVVQGDMRVQNSIRVDGKVNGNITSTDTVQIGKEGEVEGHIHARHALLAGRVSGNILTQGKVLLETKAVVLGDIRAARLVVEEGAVFNGKCTMKEDERDIEERES